MTASCLFTATLQHSLLMSYSLNITMIVNAVPKYDIILCRGFSSRRKLFNTDVVQTKTFYFT